jgi:glycosyltransferase involved in cell wall biosynthesis
MKLSVIVPVYNEIATIAEVIRRVQAAPVPLPIELIFVDDCSVDGTREFLQNLVTSEGSGSEEIKVFSHEKNLGKGAAIRTAITHVTGRWSSSRTPPRIRPERLWHPPRPILDGHADVVFGNRFHGGAHRVLYFWHAVGNRFLTTLCNMVTNLNLTDMEVGYKVFRTEILKQIQLHSSRFGFEPELRSKSPS